MQSTIVFIYISDGAVGLQVIISLPVGEAEMLAEFAYECDDEFYFIAEWICRFHSLFNLAASYYFFVTLLFSTMLLTHVFYVILQSQLEISMKKLFFLLASLALLCFVCDSCSKAPGIDSQDNSEGNHQESPDTEGGEDDGWNYPAHQNYEIVFYKCDDELNPEYKPLPANGKLEFDGNDYFITVINKNNGKYIAGNQYYAMEAKILKGDDIFQLKVQTLTIKDYHVCTLTPKALGECTLAVKISNPAGDESSIFVQKVKLSVVREKSYYLGMENSSSLPASKVGFFGNTLEYKFCWKVNNGGTLSNLNETSDSKIKFFYTGSTLNISQALSQDGTHIVYTVTRPSTSTSFLKEPIMFIYNTEQSTFLKSVVFTTYSFSTYENTAL